MSGKLTDPEKFMKNKLPDTLPADPRWDFSILRHLRKQFAWSIADLSEHSQVAASVISKLERNRSKAEIDTLYKIAQAFSMTLSDLFALAEKRTAQQTAEQDYESGDFKFSSRSYGNMRCMIAVAPAGAVLQRPAAHREDSEMCWVRRGAISIEVANKKYKLSQGMALQFDALLEHRYEVLKDCELVITHLQKNKRF